LSPRLSGRGILHIPAADAEEFLVERDEPRVLPGWSVASLRDFGEAAEAVVGYLAEALPLPTWVLVRVDEEEAIVLAAAGDTAMAPRGSTFAWAGSLSARMVTDGLRVVASAAEVDGYADVRAVRDGRVAAYLGVPICRADGTLFGVLAGVSACPATEDLAEHVQTVELLGRLLGGLLVADLRATVNAREAQRVQVSEMYDPVTGLGDRRYWHRVVAAEESRCRRYGDPAAVIVLELDDYALIAENHGPDAAQVLLRRAGRVLRTQCREEDLVARVAPGMFAVLSIGADSAGAAALVERLRSQLEGNGVAATLRHQARDPRRGLADAWLSAERQPTVDERRLA
jgi:diguanylate cyclase (GGDEF)-like protein